MAPVSNNDETLSKPIMVTCTAPVNIAVVKYWGKRNEKLILPTNDSVSVTLSSKQMHAKTTVSASPSFTDGDKLWLNSKEEDISGNTRLINCLREVRARARSLAASGNNENTERKKFKRNVGVECSYMLREQFSNSSRISFLCSRVCLFSILSLQVVRNT